MANSHLVMNKLAIIVDLSTLMYRSLYSKYDSDKENPVARKTLKYILNILNDYNPNYFALSIDSERDDIYRKKLSLDYKAGRSARPIEIAEGLSKIKEFCDIFDIKTIEDKYNESDDIIASFVKNCDSKKIYSIVVTLDGDLTSLHSKYCRIAKPTKDSIKILKSWKAIKENFGKIKVDSPDLVRDFLALVGDPSDGIKGAKGVGVKRALKLLDKYKSIKDMYDSDDELPYNLSECKESLFLSRKLVKLYDKIEINDIASFTYNKFNYDKSIEWMSKNNLASKLFNQVIDLDF